jgi:hypothetical protein
MSNANEPDQVNTGALATTIGIVACATLGIALFVTSLVREETKVLGDVRQGTQDRGIRELRADQLSVLDAAPTWKDKATGIVTLPIARAMDWMVEAVRKDPKALSPWHPPKPEALGGAGPESADASEPAGSGGAASVKPAEAPKKAASTASPAPAPAAAPATPAPAPAAPAPAPAP